MRRQSGTTEKMNARRCSCKRLSPHQAVTHRRHFRPLPATGCVAHCRPCAPPQLYLKARLNSLCKSEGFQLFGSIASINSKCWPKLSRAARSCSSRFCALSPSRSRTTSERVSLSAISARPCSNSSWRRLSSSSSRFCFSICSCWRLSWSSCSCAFCYCESRCSGEGGFVLAQFKHLFNLCEVFLP